MDIRSYSMVLLCKLWATSWAYKDGVDLADSKKGDVKQESLMNPYHKENAIHVLPSFLEFNSYVLFYGGCVTGPFFEFAYYRDWIALKGQYANMPNGLQDGFKSLMPAMIRLMHAIFFIVLNVGLLMAGFDAE